MSQAETRKKKLKLKPPVKYMVTREFMGTEEGDRDMIEFQLALIRGPVASGRDSNKKGGRK